MESRIRSDLGRMLSFPVSKLIASLSVSFSASSSTRLSSPAVELAESKTYSVGTLPGPLSTRQIWRSARAVAPVLLEALNHYKANPDAVPHASVAFLLFRILSLGLLGVSLIRLLTTRLALTERLAVDNIVLDDDEFTDILDQGVHVDNWSREKAAEQAAWQRFESLLQAGAWTAELRALSERAAAQRITAEEAGRLAQLRRQGR